jgi:hypothetical protein
MRIMQKKLASPEPSRSIVPGSGVLAGGRGAGVPPNRLVAAYRERVGIHGYGTSVG